MNVVKDDMRQRHARLKDAQLVHPQGLIAVGPETKGRQGHGGGGKAGPTERAINWNSSTHPHQTRRPEPMCPPALEMGRGLHPEGGGGGVLQGQGPRSSLPDTGAEPPAGPLPRLNGLLSAPHGPRQRASGREALACLCVVGARTCGPVTTRGTSHSRRAGPVTGVFVDRLLPVARLCSHDRGGSVGAPPGGSLYLTSAPHPRGQGASAYTSGNASCAPQVHRRRAEG